jgi:hypothetical protein
LENWKKMKRFFVTTTVFSALATVISDAVGNGQTTNGITFGGFPGPYTFQRAVSIEYNDSIPSCPLGTVSTDGGPLAPLTDEMHYIFRGPLNLLQFAVYQPSSTADMPIDKRSRVHETSKQQHRRFLKSKHFHGHRVHSRQFKKRTYGDEVIATIDGQVVSFQDTWDAPITTSQSPTTSLSSALVEVTATVNGQVVSFPDTWDTSPDAVGGIPTTLATQVRSTAIATSTMIPQIPAASSVTPNGWNRVSYFNAVTQNVQNVAFTANNNMKM